MHSVTLNKKWYNATPYHADNLLSTHSQFMYPSIVKYLPKHLLQYFMPLMQKNIQTHCNGAFKFINNACKKTLQK